MNSLKFCMGALSILRHFFNHLLIYLIIYLYHYRLTMFTVYFGLQSNTTLFCGSSYSGFRHQALCFQLLPDIFPSFVCVFSYFYFQQLITFWHRKISRLITYISSLSPKISSFSKVLSSFNWGVVSETRNWVLSAWCLFLGFFQ